MPLFCWFNDSFLHASPLFPFVWINHSSRKPFNWAKTVAQLKGSAGKGAHSVRSFQHVGEEIAISSLLALTGTIFYTLVLASEIATTGKIGIVALPPSSYQGKKAEKKAGLGTQRPQLTSVFHHKLSVSLPVSSLSATLGHCSAMCCNTEDVGN